MKRIAALAALVITMLAVPAAAAMAGTSGSGPGYGPPPRLVRIACPAPFRLHKFPKGQVTISINGNVSLQAPLKVQALLKARRPGQPVRVRITCPNIAVKPFPPGCRPQVLR